MVFSWGFKVEGSRAWGLGALNKQVYNGNTDKKVDAKSADAGNIRHTGQSQVLVVERVLVAVLVRRPV